MKWSQQDKMRLMLKWEAKLQRRKESWNLGKVDNGESLFEGQ